MSYKIIMDSCGEWPGEYEGNTQYESVPLTLEVGDDLIIDDDTFDQEDFLAKVAACPLCPRSACPSPERYLESYCTEADRVYVITLSSHLSGSHNSACLAKNLYYEKYGEKNIHVIDSESASGGETQMALKLIELEKQGLPFETIVEKIEAFRDSVRTYFVLDSLEALRKNGRLSRVKALVASTLNIKPIMAGEKGTIIQRGQTMGIRKALGKMADMVIQEAKDTADRCLIITHCNAPERAEYVRNLVMAKIPVRESIIMDTRGVSSLYASDGGVIVTI